MRIDQACDLIDAGEDNLLSIALHVGFKDPSWFTKVFRKHRGLTPRAYRKLQRAECTLTRPSEIAPGSAGLRTGPKNTRRAQQANLTRRSLRDPSTLAHGHTRCPGWLPRGR
ncbi:MAG: helix-turn-helix domain-containing protein [Planctomycetota bacterium]